VLDMEGAYGEMWATSQRCVNCGHVHDAVIEQHRLARQEKALVSSSAEPENQEDNIHLGAESFIRQAA